NRGQAVVRVDLHYGGGPLIDAVGPARAAADMKKLDDRIAAIRADLARWEEDPNADAAFVQPNRDDAARPPPQRHPLPPRPRRPPPTRPAGPRSRAPPEGRPSPAPRARPRESGAPTPRWPTPPAAPPPPRRRRRSRRARPATSAARSASTAISRR